MADVGAPMAIPAEAPARSAPGGRRRDSMRWAFAAAALILVAVGVTVVWSAQRFVTDATWVAHTHEVLSQLENVTARRREVSSSQRGYLLTARPQDREAYFEARAALRAELRRLRTLVADNAAQSAAERGLEPLIEARLVKSQATLDLFESRGLEAARGYVPRNGGLELDTRIDALTGAMKDREWKLLAARRRVSNASADFLRLTAALGIPLSLGILSMVYRLLARENAQRRVSEAAAEAANAELGRSVGRLQRLSADMAALSRYAGMLQGCVDIPELIEVSRTSLQGLLPESAGTVYLIRPSRDHAEVATTWGAPVAVSAPHPRPDECWAVRRNQPFACDDLARAVHCAHLAPPAGSDVVATHCLPLSAQGELMGWLTLCGRGPGPLPDAALAQQAAEQFSLALANLRLKESLRQQSIRDPLTGLFNRRYLEESLARELARCVRRGLPLLVMMLDLDHFKAFNDRHGHGGGDALLTAFARQLQASCRTEDIPCRYGGEEFTLILPEGDLELGLARARQLLHDTTQLVVAFRGENLSRVTASIGIAVAPRNGTSADALLAAADAALYLAKARGRNQAVAADPL